MLQAFKMIFFLKPSLFIELLFILNQWAKPHTSVLPRQQYKHEPSLVIWFCFSTNCGQQISTVTAPDHRQGPEIALTTDWPLKKVFTVFVCFNLHHFGMSWRLKHASIILIWTWLPSLIKVYCVYICFWKMQILVFFVPIALIRFPLLLILFIHFIYFFLIDINHEV